MPNLKHFLIYKSFILDLKICCKIGHVGLKSFTDTPRYLRCLRGCLWNFSTRFSTLIITAYMTHQYGRLLITLEVHISRKGCLSHSSLYLFIWFNKDLISFSVNKWMNKDIIENKIYNLFWKVFKIKRMFITNEWMFIFNEI